jgi:hypothetical protein
VAAVFETDFEDGNLGDSLAAGSSDWDQAHGAAKPTYVASTRGALAMQVQTTGSDNPSVAKTFTATTTLAIRAYVKMLTAVTHYGIQLQTTTNVRAVLVFQGNGSVRMRSHAAALGTAAIGTGALNAATWTRVEWLVTPAVLDTSPQLAISNVPAGDHEIDPVS